MITGWSWCSEERLDQRVRNLLSRLQLTLELVDADVLLTEAQQTMVQRARVADELDAALRGQLP